MPEELVELDQSDRYRTADAERIRDVDGAEEFTVTVYVRRNPDATAAPDPTAEAALHPSARRYLSPSEVEASFGADAADLDAVIAYGESAGLVASEASLATRSVRLTGRADALCAAFEATLGHFRLGEVEYRGREGKLKVPTSLDGVVQAVLGFDNRPIGRSYLRRSRSVPNTDLAASASGLPPNTYLPPMVGELYGFPTSFDGTGETVAVFVFNGAIGSGISAPGGYDPTLLGEYFTHVLGQRTPTLTNVVVQGPGNVPGNGTNQYDVSGEVYLDLCIVGSLAPGAKIAVYFTQFTEQGWVEAVSRAATDTVNNPSVLSISYGNPENDPNSAWTTMAIHQVNLAFEAAAAAGKTICCAAGDSGAADEADTHTVHADFPASSPWVLACGGTRLESSDGHVTWEVVWDDLRSGNGATGGGVSAIFPAPTWQAHVTPEPMSGVTTPRSGRCLPDVASLADPETPYVVLVPGGKLGGVGGTSAAAPLWSSLVSRLNQALGVRVGYLNPLLYSEYSGELRDIVSGNNGGYKAVAGWDACTGWGSPKATSLLEAMQAHAASEHAGA